MLVVFALIAGEHGYGLVGALFAVPVASIIQTIFVYYWRRRAAGRAQHRSAHAPSGRWDLSAQARERALQRRDVGTRSAPTMRAERSGMSSQPGREATSRFASTTTARSASCGMRRPLRCGLLRSSWA